jgi:hypothetical protein
MRTYVKHTLNSILIALLLVPQVVELMLLNIEKKLI